MNNNHISIYLIGIESAEAEIIVNAFKKLNIANSVNSCKELEEVFELIKSQDNYNNVINPKNFLIILDTVSIFDKIKSDMNFNNVPTIFILNSPKELNYIESLNLQAHGFIEKPVSEHKLVECISKLGYNWLIINRNSI